MTTTSLPRIDKYTCKFENPVIEERYMTEKWNRVRKSINFALLLVSLVFTMDLFSNYGMLGGFHMGS